MNNIDYDQLSNDIFKEQNKVRTNPKSYIVKLEKLLKYFKKNNLYIPGEIPIETYEGIQGINEAIEFLKNQNPIKPLKYSLELCKSCKDHAKDIGIKGLSSHEGSDGKGVNERIEKYSDWDGAIAENLSFCMKFAENIIMDIIINDGSKEKAQRENLFNPNFSYGGIGCDSHKTFKICVVFNYAKELYKLGELPLISENDCFEEKNLESNKPKNPFQVEDPNAPDDTESIEIKMIKKIIQGKEVNIKRTIYLLKNGKKHIIDIENSNI